MLTALDGSSVWAHDGTTHVVTEAPPPVGRGAAAVSTGDVRSPMPGSVVAVHVTDGEVVEEGAPLLVVEAMKMEHVLRAPAAGVLALHVRLGDQVVVDQQLASVTAEALT